MLQPLSVFPSFLRLNKSPLHKCTAFRLSMGVSGHVGFFLFLAVVNNAAMNMGVQISLQDPGFSSFESIRRRGILGPMMSLVLVV